MSVAVIGGGVCGTAILRELSKFDISCVLLEAHEDLCAGSSRANSAISHAGFDPRPGSLMAKLNVQGNAIMPSLCQDLGVPYRPIGSLVLAFDDADLLTLQTLFERGVQNGVQGLQLLSKEQTHTKQHGLNEETVGSLFAPSCGIVCPYKLTYALADNAVQNGCVVKLGFRVCKILRQDHLWHLYDAHGNCVTAEYLINAAGSGCQEIAEMLGDEPFDQHYRVGEYFLLDRNASTLVNHVLFQTPSAMGKGVLVTPTPDGNVLIGPSSMDCPSATDTQTTAKGLLSVLEAASRSVPSLPMNQNITTFAGVRTLLRGQDDFHIAASAKVPNVIHVAGICSPGLTSSPAIAQHVAQLLQEMGLSLEKKATFHAVRPHAVPFREMTWEQRHEAALLNPLYSHVVCRCESVTEAEIVAAIHAPVPATTLDGIKRRTRAGMGRCQGGFCSPRIMGILSRETGQDWQSLTKDGDGSWLCLKR